MHALRPSELADISAALIKAIADARPLAGRRDFGADLLELVQHARELYEIALETMAANPDPNERIRGLAATIGSTLAELEAMLTGREPPASLH